jgi:hypothetical protein
MFAGAVVWRFLLPGGLILPSHQGLVREAHTEIQAAAPAEPAAPAAAEKAEKKLSTDDRVAQVTPQNELVGAGRGTH